MTEREIRSVERVVAGQATSDGAGVRLHRTVGTQTLDQLQLVQGTRAPGLWLGDVVSGAEHIGVGSTASWSGIAAPPVTGVYRELSTPPPRSSTVTCENPSKRAPATSAPPR